MEDYHQQLGDDQSFDTLFHTKNGAAHCRHVAASRVSAGVIHLSRGDSPILGQA